MSTHMGEHTRVSTHITEHARVSTHTDEHTQVSTHMMNTQMYTLICTQVNTHG